PREQVIDGASIGRKRDRPHDSPLLALLLDQRGLGTRPFDLDRAYLLALEAVGHLARPLRRFLGGRAAALHDQDVGAEHKRHCRKEDRRTRAHYVRLLHHTQPPSAMPKSGRPTTENQNALESCPSVRVSLMCSGCLGPMATS